MLKMVRMGGAMMTKRAVVLVLAVLLLSYLPILGDEEDSFDHQFEDLSPNIERVEISPDSNSIQDLGAPLILEGSEEARQAIAHSTIGTYTPEGLIPSVYMDYSLSLPRLDLALAIIDGQVGLWDSRLDILQIEGLSIRSTIPPSGFLIQGTTEAIERLQDIESIVAIHDVPSGLMIHQSLRNHQSSSNFMVEVIGWKGDDMVRMEDSG